MSLTKRNIIIVSCVFLILLTTVVTVIYMNRHGRDIYIKGDFDLVSNSKLYNSVQEKLGVDNDEIYIANTSKFNYEDGELESFLVDVLITYNNDLEHWQITNDEVGVKLIMIGKPEGKNESVVKLKDTLGAIKIATSSIESNQYDVRFSNINISYVDSKVSEGFYLNYDEFEKIEDPIKVESHAIHVIDHENNEMSIYYYPVT